jgi:tetratricopeptide (TPR) repeat protein
MLVYRLPTVGSRHSGGRGPEAHALAARAAAAFETLDLAGEHARALVTVSSAALMLNDLAEARDVSTRAIGLAQETGDRRSEAAATGNRALVEMREGNSEAAEDALLRTVEIFRSIGHRRAAVIGLGNLSVLAAERGDYQAAREHIESGRVEAQQLGDVGLDGWLTTALSEIELRAGDVDAAKDELRNAMPQLVDAEDGEAVLSALGGAAAICGASGRHEAAGVLWAAAQSAAERAGMPLPPFGPSEQLLDAVRAAADPAVWERAWAEGTAMETDAAIEYALAELEPSVPA